MNARELHDLYAPLWAKVPETRPQLYCDKELTLTGSTIHHAPIAAAMAVAG